MRSVVQHADSVTRSAALNGAALATVGLGSAAQVALYLHDFGATHHTDGMIAAISVYSFVTTLAQLLRTSAVPLVTGRDPTVGWDSFGWTMFTTTLLVGFGGFLAAAPLAHFVAGSTGAAGIRVATTAIRVMAAAIGLQIAGAGLAVVGAVRGRLNTVAAAYAASGILGVVGYLLLVGPAGVQVLAWTNVVSALVIVAVLVPCLRVRAVLPPPVRVLAPAVAALYRSLPLPASFVVMYPLTLALAPAGPPGRITLFGLAFTASSYLSGFTAQALSMSEVVSLARTKRDQVERRIAVTRAFRYSLILAAPIAALAAIVGGSLVGAVIRVHGGASGGEFGTDIVLLGPLLVANLASWSILPVVLSTPALLTSRRLLVSVLALIALHVVATLVGRAAFGFDGVAVAMAVAPSAFVLVGQFAAVLGVARLLLKQAVIICAATALAFGALDILAHGVAVAGLGRAALVACLGSVLYGLVARRLYPQEVRTLIRLVGRR